MRFQRGSACGGVLEGARGNLTSPSLPNFSLQRAARAVPPAGAGSGTLGSAYLREVMGSDAGQQEQRDCGSFVPTDSQWVT